MIRKKAVKFKMAGASGSDLIANVNVTYYLLKRPGEIEFAGRLVSSEGDSVLICGPFSQDDYGDPNAQPYLYFQGLDASKTYTGVLVASTEEIDTSTAFDS